MSDDELFDPIGDGDVDKLVDAVLGAKKSTSYPRAIGIGNLKDVVGIDIDCYVLNDKNRTAIISQTGFVLALGYADNGESIFRLSKLISQSGRGAKLIEKLRKPLIFNASIEGKSVTSMIIGRGLNVELLIDVCNEILGLERENKLRPTQKKLAEKASIIVTSTAKLGIKNLVYKLAGYDATKEETINDFKAFVVEEIANKYESIFTDELYDQWYRIYQIEKPLHGRGRNWKLMYLTMDHIYYNVAKSKGKIKELLRIKQEANKGKRKRKLHEFLLAETGIPALRETITQVTTAARLSNSEEDYEANMEKLFGKMDELKIEEAKAKRYVLISASENCDLAFIKKFITPYAGAHKLKDDEVVFVVVNDENDPCYRLTKEYEIPYQVAYITVTHDFTIPDKAGLTLWNKVTESYSFSGDGIEFPRINGMIVNGSASDMRIPPLPHPRIITVKQ